MKHCCSRRNTEGSKGNDPRIVPSLIFFVVHNKHVIREYCPESYFADVEFWFWSGSFFESDLLHLIISLSKDFYNFSKNKIT